MTLGVRHNKVRLAKYDNKWPKYFDVVAAELKRILGEDVVAVEHVGSTAIVGLSAKPIVDVLVGVRSMKHHALYVRKLEASGYVNTGASFFRADHHLMFSKRADGATTHHIHIVSYRRVLWKNMVGFRDHLNSSKAARDEYLQLKQSGQKKFKNDRIGYTNSKSAYVKRILNLLKK